MTSEAPAPARSANSAAASEPARPSASPATSDSGGTVTVRSPATASRSRLVASTRTPGQAASSRSANAATTASRCSQLSSTSSDRRAARCSATASSSGCRGRSETPSTDATAWATKPSRTGTRSAKAQPDGNDGAASRVTATARRVLPTPPGPTSVTRWASRRAARTAARSRSRPTKLVHCTGRPSGAAAGRAAGASAASSRRSATPNFRSRDETWLSTVRTEICRRPAICALLRRAPTAASTSASRVDIPAGRTSPTTCSSSQTRAKSVPHPWWIRAGHGCAAGRVTAGSCQEQHIQGRAS